MRQCKILLGICLLMCMASTSFAATNVVVFNLQQAILSSDRAQKTLEKLRNDSEFAAMQATLESLKSDLEKLRKESDTKGMTWSADQVADHRKKMESVGSDLQYTAKKMQSQQQAVMEGIMKEMQPHVEKALTEVVAAEKVDLVLDAQSAYFRAPKVDITEAVTAKLNQVKSSN